MCRITSLFLSQRPKGSMSGDARDFNNIETRAVIKFFFSPERQGAEGNSRHSERNIRGTRTVVCHRQNWMAITVHLTTRHCVPEDSNNYIIE
jgi:hypothetical protein